MQNPLRYYFFDPYVIKIGLEGGVWEPTPHGLALAEGMVAAREAICHQTVLELGAGCGIHAILAAKIGAAAVDITEINQSYLDNAAANGALNGISYRQALVRDWSHFSVAEGYDLLLCNPPFCKSGKPIRRHFIHQLLQDTPKLVRSGGKLLFVQSSMADFRLTEQQLQDLGMSYRVVLQKRGVFRDYYFTEPNFMEESATVANGYELIDGCYIETLRVYLATLP
ncbi:hypothetical protein D5085_01750 [Ectothiorhodospiraceae bacterium BW-2]|nr:hypothetical protein D5085_01750 [Ectothiorhodospiraceae bacterium BW-2]